MAARNDNASKLEHFSRIIKLHEDLLFGLTLFSDCMAACYRGQPDIFILNDKTFQDIKRKMDAAIVRARELCRQIKAGDAGAAEIDRFEFPSLSDYPLINRVSDQAQILVKTYDYMFPGRSRSCLLSHKEIVYIMPEALRQFKLLKKAERLSNFTKEIN